MGAAQAAATGRAEHIVNAIVRAHCITYAQDERRELPCQPQWHSRHRAACCFAHAAAVRKVDASGKAALVGAAAGNGADSLVPARPFSQ
jgi:hypothetical protein